MARATSAFVVDKEFTTAKFNSSAADINVVGAFDVDATGAVSVNSSAGVINVGNDAIAQAINVGTGAAARTLTVGNTTGATAVVINAGTGATTVNGGLIPKSAAASAIAAVTTLSADDSGGVFSVAKTGAYAITLPTPEQGLSFKFLVLDTGANIVTISNGSAHLFGTVSIANVATAATGTTIGLASGGSVGDWVQFEGIDATHYLVTGACIAASDITVT